MKNKFKQSLLAAGLCAALVTSATAAENLLNNPSFEEEGTTGIPLTFDAYLIPNDAYDPLDPENTGPEFFFNGALFGSLLFEVVPGWQNEAAFSLFNGDGFGANPVAIGTPAVGASDGSNALHIPIASGRFGDIPFVFQRAYLNPNLLAQPGEEYYASVEILREELPTEFIDFEGNPALPIALLGLAFYDDNGVLLEDMAPASISKGTRGDCPFPAANAPGGDFTDPALLNQWTKLQSQAVTASADTILIDCEVKAPADTASIGFYLFNIDFSGDPKPVWFDNAFLGKLEPDDDGDRIQNGVDVDPITASADFSDGTSSGTVVSDGDSILAIDDAADPALGINIVSDPGMGSPARVRVCDSLASIRIERGSELDVTCGSVILNVADGSAPVALEIVIDGQPAVITVPANNDVTFDDEAEVVSVADSSTGDPVTFTQGDSSIQIAAGQTLSRVEIDVKPGDEPNCFNINGHGVIPVAILGSDTVDVSTVDRGSLAFSGLAVRVRGNDARSCGIEDVNADGFDDLVCQFEDDGQWTAGGSVATLQGLIGDEPFSGSDNICIVP